MKTFGRYHRLGRFDRGSKAWIKEERRKEAARIYLLLPPRRSCIPPGTNLRCGEYRVGQVSAAHLPIKVVYSYRAVLR